MDTNEIVKLQLSYRVENDKIFVTNMLEWMARFYVRLELLFKKVSFPMLEFKSEKARLFFGLLFNGMRTICNGRYTSPSKFTVTAVVT